MAKTKNTKKGTKKVKTATPTLKAKKFRFTSLPKIPRVSLPKHIFALIFLAVAAVGVWLFWGLPLAADISDLPAVSTKIFDRNGKLIYEIFADQRRTPMDIEELPPYVKQATIAIEDKDFYNHPGFDVAGITRAAYKTLSNQRLEGGSTLTQQLVKIRLLTPERTIKRKIQELALAVLTEVRYSKDEILQLYLNQIPYGSTAYGIGAASELYFGKSAKDLTLAEASMLAGLPAAPTKFSPFGARPELAKGRQEAVLRRMVEDGYITEEQAQEALNEELKFAEVAAPVAPHFALWVREILADRYGEAVVEQGGLRVTTTLDLDLQEFAQQAVADEVASLASSNVRNGAALVTKPDTGEILAMVGSKDYFAEDEDGKVNIIFANRQPGSSIKPLNYALALEEKKITAATVIADIPTCFSVVGQQPYCPVNYDRNFHGAVNIRESLANSFNIPAVRVLALNGVDNFINFATKMGITTFRDPSRYGLSLTLGGGEVKPYDMAVAFGVFANGGVKQPLTPILKIEDWKGNVLEEANFDEQEGDRVLDQGVAFIISHILQDNVARARAFGSRSDLFIPDYPSVSVKTGTTNDLRDNWTIGYTEDVLVLTWVGNNNNEPMRGTVSGVSGASPIWHTVIEESLKKMELEDKKLSPPDSVVGINVCSNTGGAFFEGLECPSRFEYFLKDNTPTQTAFKQEVFVDRNLQVPAVPETPQENIESQQHTMVTDPLGTIICLTCPFPMPTASIRYPL